MIEERNGFLGPVDAGIPCDPEEESFDGTAPPPPGQPDRRRRNRRRSLRWLAVPVGAAVLLLSFSLAKGLGQPQFAPSALLGKPVPAFVLQSIDNGAAVDSSRFRGRVVIVNFWASWCVPCREEAATLENFAVRNADAGVELIGVLYSDTRSNARDFRDEFRLTYPLVDDPSGATAIDFGVRGVPETFIIGPDGRVMARLIGAVGPTTLDGVVQQVLAGETYTSKNTHYRTGPDPAAASGAAPP